MSNKHASHTSAYLMVYTSACEMLNNSFTATFQSCQTETKAGKGMFFNKSMGEGLRYHVPEITM